MKSRFGVEVSTFAFNPGGPGSIPALTKIFFPHFFLINQQFVKYLFQQVCNKITTCLNK
jgi:hypothetical protein